MPSCQVLNSSPILNRLASSVLAPALDANPTRKLELNYLYVSDPFRSRLLANLAAPVAKSAPL